MNATSATARVEAPSCAVFPQWTRFDATTLEQDSEGRIAWSETSGSCHCGMTLFRIGLESFVRGSVCTRTASADSLGTSDRQVRPPVTGAAFPGEPIHDHRTTRRNGPERDLMERARHATSASPPAFVVRRHGEEYGGRSAGRRARGRMPQERAIWTAVSGPAGVLHPNYAADATSRPPAKEVRCASPVAVTPTLSRY